MTHRKTCKFSELGIDDLFIHRRAYYRKCSDSTAYYGRGYSTGPVEDFKPDETVEIVNLSLSDAYIKVGSYLYDPHAKIFGQVESMEEITGHSLSGNNIKVLGVKVVYKPVFRRNGKPIKGARKKVINLAYTTNAMDKAESLIKNLKSELAALESLKTRFEEK
jgi:hypothetical protein